MNDPLNSMRKKLHWRAWHRGTKELDHLMGQFVDLHLAKMTEEQMLAVADFMQEPEPELTVWLTDSSTVPEHLPAFLRDWLRSYEFDPIYQKKPSS